jgi:hypothetical protein
MTYFVYIMASKRTAGTLYTGLTTDLARRAYMLAPAWPSLNSKLQLEASAIEAASLSRTSLRRFEGGGSGRLT